MGKVGDTSFQAPESIQAHHDIDGFDSGEPTLDRWLRQRALKSHREGASRTYVVCTNNNIVVGYFSLSVGSLARSIAVGKVRRNMPDPIPVMLITRLAVANQWKGYGLGASMLRDALARTLQAAAIAGIRAIAIHAISQDAKRFYQYFGFHESTSEPMTLMATLAEIQAAF